MKFYLMVVICFLNSFIDVQAQFENSYQPQIPIKRTIENFQLSFQIEPLARQPDKYIAYLNSEGISLSDSNFSFCTILVMYPNMEYHDLMSINLFDGSRAGSDTIKIGEFDPFNKTTFYTSKIFLSVKYADNFYTLGPYTLTKFNTPELSIVPVCKLNDNLLNVCFFTHTRGRNVKAVIKYGTDLNNLQDQTQEISLNGVGSICQEIFLNENKTQYYFKALAIDENNNLLESNSLLYKTSGSSLPCNTSTSNFQSNIFDTSIHYHTYFDYYDDIPRSNNYNPDSLFIIKDSTEIVNNAISVYKKKLIKTKDQKLKLSKHIKMFRNQFETFENKRYNDSVYNQVISYKRELNLILKFIKTLKIDSNHVTGAHINALNPLLESLTKYLKYASKKHKKNTSQMNEFGLLIHNLLQIKKIITMNDTLSYNLEYKNFANELYASNLPFIAINESDFNDKFLIRIDAIKLKDSIINTLHGKLVYYQLAGGFKNSIKANKIHSITSPVYEVLLPCYYNIWLYDDRAKKIISNIELINVDPDNYNEKYLDFPYIKYTLIAK